MLWMRTPETQGYIKQLVQDSILANALDPSFSYPCSTAIQEADDHPSHVFQKKEKILLEKTMPSLRTLSTQGQAQQGQRTFRQEIIPSVTRPVSWSTAHNWQEDNSEPVISTEEVHCEVLPGSEGSRLGRKKLNYNLVTTEGIAHSMESSRAGTTLQSYFLIKARDLGFNVLLQSVIECGLGENISLSETASLDRDSTVT
eukprot:XP_022258998.1 uncharacterized protein LOC111090036 isoform X2 [Canis lupus familiaris]